MANTLITTEGIALQALASLSETLVMKPLIHTDLSEDFKARGVGDTVNVRKPAQFVAKDFNRSTGIEIQDATEGKVAVKLDKFKDVSFTVTDEELAMNIDDFDAQFLTPAMEAIAVGVDTAILDLRTDVTHVVGDKTTPEFPWNKPEALTMAGAVLDQQLVPAMDRAAVVGPLTKANWLNSSLLKTANQSGSTTGLRKASLGGDLFGFDIYATNNIKPPKPVASQSSGDPTTEIGMAFHKSAIAFASAELPVHKDVDCHVVSYEGLSLRVTRAFDIAKKSSIISVDVLFGVKMLDPNRAVLIKGDDKS